LKCRKTVKKHSEKKADKGALIGEKNVQKYKKEVKTH